MKSAASLGEPSLAFLERLHAALWVFDIDHGRVFWANDSGLAVWDATSLEELRARDLRADMSAAVEGRLRQYQADFVREPDTSFSELWTLYPRGKPRPLRVVFSCFHFDDGRLGMLCEASAERGPADPENLRSSEALLHTTVMITMYALDGKPLYRNPSARSATSDPQATLSSHFVQRVDHEELRRQLEAETEGRLVARVHTDRGERWHEVTARRSHDAVSGDVAWLVSEVDVTELKDAEAREAHLANHDPLTGLPNRNFVTRSFEQRIDSLARAGRKAALLFIDLDNFKNLNDSLGHAAGDAFLVEIAQRLRQILRPADQLARLGGDEFLVLLEADSPRAHVSAITQRILHEIAQAVRLGEHHVRITTTMGVAFFPDDGGDLGTLMRHADLALHKAKGGGRNRVGYFEEALNVAARARLNLENELRQALERSEFEIYLQPRLDVRTNAVRGAEALVRWNHPQRGFLLPGEFIATAEETGLIGPLGAFVLEAVAQTEQRFRDFDLSLSANLSPRQFHDPGFLDAVKAIVKRTGCDTQRIELEITESMLLGHGEETEDALESLCAMGFRISIDDFGTGYSNLGYLQRYPIHALKIDRSFMVALDRGTPIAELIVTMCKLLGVETVAEGVETQDQLDWLKRHECDEYQGFLVSRAVPVADFERDFAPRARVRMQPR